MLPGDNISGILLMPRDAVIEFGALRICQRDRICLQALPDGIQKFGLFLGG